MKLLSVLFPLLSVVAVQAMANPAPSAQKINWALQGQTVVKAAWVFTICDIELYTPALNLPSESILDDSIPLALAVSYARNISADQLISYANDALSEQYSESELEPYQTAIDSFNSAYVDVSDGDTYRIEYLPQNGITLFRNNDFVYHNSDSKFARVYLSIWLGNHKAATKLKQKLIPASQAES